MTHVDLIRLFDEFANLEQYLQEMWMEIYNGVKSDGKST